MSKNKNTSALEVKEKELGGAEEPKKENQFVSVLDPNLGDEITTKTLTKEEEEVEIEDDELYTLKDNRLFIPGVGTLVKDPKEPKPLSSEHLKALFDYAIDNGFTKEIAIKKHLVRLKLVEIIDVRPVSNKLEKYVVDKE